jgi:hypothetical protein
MQRKVRVLHAGSYMVLAAHRTPVGSGLVATTVETVGSFDRSGSSSGWSVARCPRAEEFMLGERDGGTELAYHGELGTDFGPVGRWRAGLVAHRWQGAVARTFDAVSIRGRTPPFAKASLCQCHLPCGCTRPIHGTPRSPSTRARSLL